MGRHPHRSIWFPTIGPFLVMTITGLAFAPSAEAGIGNPLKKAKEAIGKSGTPKPASQANKQEPPIFDDVTLELTEERVGNLCGAFAKAREASAGRPALVEKLGKVKEERGAIWEKHGNDIMERQRKRGEIEVCYHDGYQAATDRKLEEYQQRALADPALLKKFQEAAAEYNAAAAKGDSAALAKLNAVAMGEIFPTREDSAKVRKDCGPLPPPTKEEDRIKALDKEEASIEERIRAIDQKVAEAQANQGKLSQQQWGMAIERIQLYLGNRNSWERDGGKKSGSTFKHGSFTDEELKALEKHLEELRTALG